MKKILIVFLILVIVAGGIALFVTSYFEAMPENAKIRNIEINEYDVKFFLTEDNKLYVGGIHMDSMGLFDDTGFRWSFMYALRGIFGKTDVPVLFAENVAQVFEASDGFLFTDLDGTLYYFGSQSGGENVKVAENVICASSDNRNIFYVTTESDVYRKAFNKENATQVGTDAVSVYSNGLVFRIVTSSGEIYQIDAAGTVGNSSQKRNSVLQAQDDYDSTCVLDSEGKLTLHQWDTGITGGENNTPYFLSDNVLSSDMNFDRICYLTKAGELRSVFTRGGIENAKTIQTDRTDIVDIAVAYSEVFVLYSDGSYQIYYTGLT